MYTFLQILENASFIEIMSTLNYTICICYSADAIKVFMFKPFILSFNFTLISVTLLKYTKTIWWDYDLEQSY